MPTINIGQTAPAFSLPDQHGNKHSLSHYRGRPVVIYFYPEDDTPLCTNQACGLRDTHAEFAKLNAAVIGISPDTVESHDAFARKFSLKFALLADVPDAGGTPRVCESYGAWGEKSMYGRTVISILRTTYLIDGDGRVAKRWDRVKTPGHAERVLQAVRDLQSGQLDRPAAKAAPRAEATGPRESKHARAKQAGSNVTPVRSARQQRPAK